VAARRKTTRQLGREPNRTPDTWNALISAMQEDDDPEVRRTCASAIARSQDPARVEPLLKLPRDRDCDVLRAAIHGLRRSTNPRTIPALIPLLRHDDFIVRSAAAQTIDTIPWIPKERDERIWFYGAKGWFERLSNTGPEAIPVLQLNIQKSPVSFAARAAQAL